MKDINKRIASTLKELRQARRWSLDKAALETGVSKAMLGQIERGESSPTISTLWKIASGFQASFSSFIEAPSDNLTSPMVRSGQTEQLHPTDKKIRVMPIFPFDQQLQLEIYIIELLPGCVHLSPPHASGVIEHVIVTTGTMDVLVNGHWQALKKGEGLRFAANQPHGYRNRANKTACFHDIIHYPQ